MCGLGQKCVNDGILTRPVVLCVLNFPRLIKFIFIKLTILWVANCDDPLLLRPEAATVRQQHL